MLDLLKTPIFAPLTVGHAIAILVTILVIASMKSRMDGHKPALTTKIGVCPGCGFTGQVSMHAPRCSKCGRYFT